MMLKKSLWLTIIMLLYTVASFAQTGISASPMKLNFDGIPGSAQVFTVIVSNPSSKPLELRVDISDWKRNEQGNIICLPAGSLSSSCANWVKVFPATNFALAPLAKKEVTVMLSVPDSLKATAKNSMVFFTQLNPDQTTEKGLNINLAVRIGVQVFYTPPGTGTKDIEIAAFADSTIAATDSQKVLLLTLQNNGGIETDGKVDYELTNMTTGEKTTLPESSFYTLPTAIRIIRIPLLPKLKTGKYGITALVDYGQDQELKIGELEFKK